jgi:TRAP-type mannitol/chloroaromatic compound transport system permease small subunit
MGENVEKLDLHEVSVYFFEKIFSLTQNFQIKENSAIKLSIIYFKLA